MTDRSSKRIEVIYRLNGIQFNLDASHRDIYKYSMQY